MGEFTVPTQPQILHFWRKIFGQEENLVTGNISPWGSCQLSMLQCQ